MKDFSLLKNILTGLGAHPASWAMGTDSSRGKSGRRVMSTTYP